MTINVLVDVFQILNAAPDLLDDDNTAEFRTRPTSAVRAVLMTTLHQFYKTPRRARDFPWQWSALVALGSVQYAVKRRRGPALSFESYDASAAAKKSPRAAATAPGRSIGVRWPAAGIVTMRARDRVRHGLESAGVMSPRRLR